MRNLILLMSSMLMPSFCLASNLGNYGQIFEVKEVDIRAVIQNKLSVMEKTGELETRKKEAVDRISKQVIRPKSLSLTKLNKTTVHYIDPSITVNKDVYTPNGQLIVKAGTKVNPFERITLSKALFFFDSDDEKQIEWVKSHYQQYNQVKFILTSGNVKDATNLFGKVYFDMGGEITAKLNVKHVPAVAIQDGLKWKVTQIGGLQ